MLELIQKLIVRIWFGGIPIFWIYREFFKSDELMDDQMLIFAGAAMWPLVYILAPIVEFMGGFTLDECQILTDYVNGSAACGWRR